MEMEVEKVGIVLLFLVMQMLTMWVVLMMVVITSVINDCDGDGDVVMVAKV